MDVTDVLRDRMQAPPGLQRMVVVSALVHAGLVAAIIVGPGDWMAQRRQPPRPVMTVSLGSGAAAPGPQSGGLTAMGGRAVQVQTPPDVKRPEPATQPAAKSPAMTMPLPGKPVKTTPAPAVKQAPDAARGRTPSQGAETRDGSTTIETNVRGQGFGLSTSSGVGKGIQLDVTDFCCPWYLDTMSQRIRQNWDPRAETPSQVTIKFTIRRDGMIVGITPEKSSGNSTLDLRAQRSIVTTRQLPALPADFPNPELVVHLTFEYIR
jgi:TonB family protein